MNEPTNCDKCDGSLERGYSFTYNGNTIVSALCFPCARQRDLEEYLETKILRTNFVMENSMELYEASNKYWHFNHKERDHEFLLNWQYITSDPVLEARIKAQLAVDDIYEKMKLFESKVWFGGLQKIIRSATKKGVSAKIGDYSVLTYSMAGRTMFTFETPEASITTITAEDESEPRMGLQGFCCTGKQGVELIERALKEWENGNLDFKQDTQVSII